MILKELRIKVNGVWHYFGDVKFDEIELNAGMPVEIEGEAKVYSCGKKLK